MLLLLDVGKTRPLQCQWIIAVSEPREGIFRKRGLKSQSRERQVLELSPDGYSDRRLWIFVNNTSESEPGRRRRRVSVQKLLSWSLAIMLQWS